MIKYLIAILLTASAAYSQTIKTLGYNTTNGQVAYSGSNTLTFTNPIGFSNAATTRTNLGLGWSALTNTNATNFRSDIGLSLAALTNTNVTNFRTDIGLGSLATNNSVPSGAATTNSLLTADGAGGSAFVATLPKLTLGAGLATNPSFVLTGSSVGIYQRTAGELTFTDGTEPQMRYFANNLMFNSDFLLSWGNSTTQPVTGDTYILRDTTNTLASRNGTNPQVYNIYNTYSNSTNYERGRIAWTNNVLTIGTEKGSGGGTARALELQTDGTTRATISTAGSVTLSAGLSVVSSITFQGNSSIVGNISSGVIRLLDAGGTSFNRIQFGGSTTGFPALKRNTNFFQARLADDSDYTVMDAQLRAQGTAPTNSTAAGTAGDIRYDTNNFLYICVSSNTWRRIALTNW